jgi:ubiquitin C-terminal hydrolase
VGGVGGVGGVFACSIHSLDESLYRIFAALMRQMVDRNVSSSALESMNEWKKTQLRGGESVHQDAHEFLVMLLDGLHEELKSKARVNAVANDTILCDLFFGQFKSSLQCPNEACNAIDSFDAFNNLALQVSTATHTIDDCFDAFVAEEQLDAANLWYEIYSLVLFYLSDFTGIAITARRLFRLRRNSAFLVCRKYEIFVFIIFPIAYSIRCW